MTISVRFHSDFRDDLRKQLQWLEEQRQSSWMIGLRTGIDEAIDLVSRFPNVGTIEAEDEQSVLRRLILRKVPYVIWFSRQKDDPAADIWFLRLFHARQERPQPSTAARARRRR